MAFKFRKLEIPGIVHVQTDLHKDDRGFFSELFKQSEFTKNGIPGMFAQVNVSHSQKNVIRGLHYQKNPKAQGKLVSVLSGKIFDVAVDIRAGSPHFGRWAGLELSAEKGEMLYIPQGFAHGFCVLSEEATVVYYCSEEYSKEDERGVLFNDPAIGINWPLAGVLVSDKDKQWPVLKKADNDFIYTK